MSVPQDTALEAPSNALTPSKAKSTKQKRRERAFLRNAALTVALSSQLIAPMMTSAAADTQVIANDDGSTITTGITEASANGYQDGRDSFFDWNAEADVPVTLVAQSTPNDVGTVTESITAQVQNQQAAQEDNALSVTSTSIAFSPLIPLWMILAGSGLYGGLCLWAARGNARGAFLRASAGAVLAITLANPQILQEERETLTTEVAIVVDRSASQALDGRIDATEESYRQLVEQLQAIEGVNVRTITVGTAGLHNSEADHEEDNTASVSDGSYLFRALDEALSDVPRDQLGGVIILTDGQVHDVPQTADFLGSDAPVHVLISGREDEFDRKIILEQTPRFGLVGSDQILQFRILDEGIAPGDAGQQPVRVSLSYRGEPIASQEVIPGQAGQFSVTLDHAGTNNYALAIDALDGELTDINNIVTTGIEGIREDLNVLLISGSPNAGGRMWRSLLKSDPGTNLIHFTILREPFKQDFTPLDELSLIAVPTDEIFNQRINEFDLIIFDHYANRRLVSPVYLDNIANYVENGGALLVLSGPEYAHGRESLYETSLSRVLPARPDGTMTEEPFRPALSEDGLRHPVTRNLDGANESAADTPIASPANAEEALLQQQNAETDADQPNDEASWGRWMTMVNTEATDGNVVMRGVNGQPLLILDREGQGRVGLMLSDNAWLWSRGIDGGGPHRELLQNTAQWLMRNPALEEESVSVSQDGQTLNITVQSLQDAIETVRVTSPSGEVTEVPLTASENGQFTATIPADELGLYRVERIDDVALALRQEEEERNAGIASPNADTPGDGALPSPVVEFAQVGPTQPLEFDDTRSTLAVLAPLTEGTGGALRRMQNAAANGAVEMPRVEARIAQEGTEAPQFGEDWIAVNLSQESQLKGLEQNPLLPAWLGLIAAIGFIGAAYYQEGDKTRIQSNLARFRRRREAKTPNTPNTPS